jgi:hypothetical protein
VGNQGGLYFISFLASVSWVEFFVLGAERSYDGLMLVVECQWFVWVDRSGLF